jgi:hypothetical protein
MEFKLEVKQKVSRITPFDGIFNSRKALLPKLYLVFDVALLGSRSLAVLASSWLNR